MNFRNGDIVIGKSSGRVIEITKIVDEYEFEGTLLDIDYAIGGDSSHVYEKVIGKIIKGLSSSAFKLHLIQKEACFEF
ncbi:MAG: hypothetical protein RR744_00285 [Cellulosilyticaceae bacterium]